MLWDPGSVEKDGEEEHKVPVTPILVPLQSESSTTEKGVPVLVPDVQELKDQFQQQQNMLSQIKETLIQNESQLSSKGKQIEAYANKLSQIKARSKNTQGKKSSAIANSGGSEPKLLTKKSSKENLTKVEGQNVEKAVENNSKVNRRGKISELKKCVEENKIKFEERTGKEQSETKKIESLVEQLKMQLEERDKTIQDLQKTIEEPSVMKPDSLQDMVKSKSGKEFSTSKTTQTIRSQNPEESIEIIALQNKIHELEANVLDLEENLKEKESVIEARTQAVTLLSQDLSLKGKNTLESLEETRQEMRTMQNNFIAIEGQLKKDLSDRDKRLIHLEEKCKKLESTNFDLSLKNAEQQEKLVKLQQMYLELENEKKSTKESAGDQVVRGDDKKLGELTKKISVLTKELDDRNKATIKMKIEHKNKLKNLNKTIETLKGSSDDKAEILRLSNLVQELENAKTTLENRVAELEDEKVTEKKLKEQISELEAIIQKHGEDLRVHLETISSLEKEKSDLMRSIDEKNVLIGNLEARASQRSTDLTDKMMEDGGGSVGDQSLKLKELSKRLENLEAEHNRKMEDLKLEHRKEIEMLESYYSGKGEGLDRKELEEYRISTEISNIHIEEQIELLKCEKQQLLEKLKSLLGVSSTDSMSFEKMEYSDLRDDKETTPQLGVDVDLNIERDGENRIPHLQRIVNDQQALITDLQRTVTEEKQKASTYRQKITELEGTVKRLEDVNVAFRQQIESSEPTESGKAQKSNVNAKNRLKKIEMELSQSKKTIQEQSKKLKDLNTKLEEKEELIKKYTEKIELFEKDDWDRQNHWQNPEDGLESVQELQKKCLSLENSLLELNEDCERLRKENIEVVHLLSEEKVKRKKLLEQLSAKPESEQSEIEERVEKLHKVLKDLEEKIEKLETKHAEELVEDWPRDRVDEREVQELQGKLEWTNVVLTSKETEIFRLQNLLEDRCKQIENLEADLASYQSNLAEKEKRCDEMAEELKAKDVQLEEISRNFDKLQECVDVANEKTAMNESQLKELSATVKEMEGDVLKKETELQEMKGILAEKNLDMTNLRNRLEEVNSDLTYSYQEHLENMGKCLRDKESEYDALVAEKSFLEDLNRSLVAEKEEIYNEKVRLINEKEKVEEMMSEKEKEIDELKAKLANVKTEEVHDLKVKVKKLAANLKKKIQNETDLVKQVKDLEGFVLEKDKVIAKLETELNEVTEKWTTERSEKEEIRRQLDETVNGKNNLEKEALALNEKVSDLEKELVETKCSQVDYMIELEDQVRILTEDLVAHSQCEDIIKEYKAETEARVSEFYQSFQEVETAKLQELEENRKSNNILFQKLCETMDRCKKFKTERDQLRVEKSKFVKKLEELEKSHEDSFSQKSALEAKLQENLAVIDSLETELKRTEDRLKSAEEKFFNAEERRLSLENKNEEMCKKIMEDSENLVTIDDLANRIDELLKSEKYLNDCVKNLETGNSELQQSLEEAQSQKYNFEMELKSSAEKLTELSKELSALRDSDLEKSGLIGELSKELEKLKLENKQITEEFEKLNRDYEQFENDFKENLENSQNVEKNLRHRIEELTNENAGLVERCNLLTDEKSQKEEKKEEEEEEGGEEKKRKKRKSVTFRTDEVEYIKDLKSQLHSYDDSLKQANEEIMNLKAELLREKLKAEVTNVVVEAQEKVESLRSTPDKKLSLETSEPIIQKSEWTSLEIQKSSPEEKKFDASVFFGGGEPAEESFFSQTSAGEKTRSEDEPQPNSDFDSLMWDDGWGTDGHLEEEYLSGKVVESVQTHGNDAEKKIESLQVEMDNLKAENERLAKELQEATAKYTKALKKLKEQKSVNEKLQSEVNKSKSSSGFGDLEAAIVDELKSQIQAMETKEKELLKNLENAKLEKESLMKRVEVLNAGNEKFLEMKERQDNEVEIWQMKNQELLKEISILRQQVKEPAIQDDRELAKENVELKNKVEALEWKICEMNEILEEKQEMLEGRGEKSSDVEKVMEEKSLLQREIDELNNVKERLEKKLFDEEKKNSIAMGELNEQLTALATENETLQDILGEMKAASEAAKKDKDKPKESKIFDYFKSSPADDLFPVSQPSQEKETDKSKDAEVEGLKERINQLAESLRLKEDEANRELVALRSRIAELEAFAQMKEGEVNNLWQKITELEAMVNAKEQELNNLRQMGMEIDSLKQNLVELEGMLRMRNQELTQLSAVNVEKQKEVEVLRQRLFELETEKESGVVGLNQRIFDLENLVRSREEELDLLRQEREGLKQRIVELETSSSSSRAKEDESNQFETIDLNQESEKLIKLENEVESFRLKVSELEALLMLKEEHLARLETNLLPETERELEDVKRRLFQTENLLRAREDEISQLMLLSNQNQNSTTAEFQEIREKMKELQTFMTLKESQAYQVKETEIKNLNEKILELENMIKFREEEGIQIQIQKCEETERLRQQVLELEQALSLKNNEVTALETRLNELEKSYNDSKLEIERLLNEEKLNTEEKFAEPFQKNIQIPVAFEVEALSRTLNEEKEKFESLKYEATEKDNLLREKDDEIKILNDKVLFLEAKLRQAAEEDRLREMMKNQAFEGKALLEEVTADLEVELENTKLHLNVSQTELQELRQIKEEQVTRLRNQVTDLEEMLERKDWEINELRQMKGEEVTRLRNQVTELEEMVERKDWEINELRQELKEKMKNYEEWTEKRKAEESLEKEEVKNLEKAKHNLEMEVKMLKSHLEEKENDISSLGEMLNADRSQLVRLSQALEARENEVDDLKRTLIHLQSEITQFRNFEKQVKELRVAQIKEFGSHVPVNSEGRPDYSGWTEQELAELSSKLQSDLDSALYMLHQRDVRCDELTFELMQLLEERDTLQLRLSTALRINEELRSVDKAEKTSSSHSLQESKDLVDQSNDRQAGQSPAPSEDLRQLSNKISELHSVSYLRDKTVKDDSMQRHREQMSLLTRVSESDVSLSRDAQGSSTVLDNWTRGKTIPKVMHI